MATKQPCQKLGLCSQKTRENVDEQDKTLLDNNCSTLGKHCLYTWQKRMSRKARLLPFQGCNEMSQ